MSYPSPDDIALRFGNTEDVNTERKVASDVSDVLKTAVAFANSLPPEARGVVFIPVRNDSCIEVVQNLESLAKKVSERIGQAYPPIAHEIRTFTLGSSQCLAVVVWGSLERPHFAGPSYVRRGPESVKASPEQFALLVAQRNSKVFELSKHVGTCVTIHHLHAPHHSHMGVVEGTTEGILEFVGPWYLILKVGSDNTRICQPLSRIGISFDTARERPIVEIHKVPA